MNPPSIPLEEISDEIARALDQAGDIVREAWERIRVTPQRWRCGASDGVREDFWIFAILGDQVVWYNHIEEGFNTSRFSTPGVFDEYGCNQSPFTQILANLPEGALAEGHAAAEPATSVPPALRLPGRIEARQTTYWELRSRAGAGVRCHFSGKLETRFVDGAYGRVELADEHPRLAGVREPWGTSS